jgi:hypothetical protein
MKRMNKIAVGLTVVTCLAIGFNLPAGAEEGSEHEPHPFGLSVDVGPFTGLGGILIWRPFDHFGVRGGLHYAKVSLPEFEVENEYGGTDATYDFEVVYQSAPLTLDFYPWKSRYFRISAGVLLDRNEFSTEATGNIEVNGNPYPGEQLNSTVEWDDYAPYLAIGGDFFCFDKAKRWSLGWEIGAAYTGSPTVTVVNPTGNIPQGDVDAAQKDLEEGVESVTFWVVAKLSLTFRF